MKKFTIITFVLVLAFALLSACGSHGGSEEQPPIVTVEKWTVSFDLNGGTVDGADTLAPVEVIKGESLGDNYKTAVRAGSWAFGGWFDESVEPHEEYKADTAINKDLTLKVKWLSTDPNKWVVSFNTDGGEPHIADILVTKGEAMGDQYPEDPSKARHVFEGWYLASDTNFSGTKYEAHTPAIEEDTELKAKWKSTDITIVIDMVDNVDTDSVTTTPTSGQIGDQITINYTLASTKANNRLVFSGTIAVIAEVDEAGTGTKTYTIAEADATEGVITIIATFAHSDKTLDTIAFADSVGVTKIYGDPSYTKDISNTGSGTGAITYSSDNQTVATVNSTSGAVTILKVGTTTITATKAEDATYSSAKASYVLTVEKLQLTITGTTVTTKQYDSDETATVTPGTLENKVGSDDVTVSATGTFDSENVGTNKTVYVVYTITGGADAGNYIAPEEGTATGTITKATGRTIAAVPTLASRTQNSITINTAAVSTPDYGQAAEYTISTAATLAGSETWQDGLTFTGLTGGTTYYVFARSKANSNCDVGAAQVSAAMKTSIIVDPAKNTVVDFEDVAIGTTYNTAAIKVAADPIYSGERSLQITNNNYNQYAVVPVNLPYELQNYQSFSFRFNLVGGTDLSNKSIVAYAASANAINTTQANQVGTTGNISFNDTYKNKWTDYTFTFTSLNSAITSLKGVIYLTIGINVSIDFMIDDLIFTLKDDFDPPAIISPTTATFDKDATAEGYKDIPVTMTLQGKSLSSIANGGSTLTSSSDYTISGSTVTLKTSYLSTQAVGTTTLTFNFSSGTPSTIAILIKDSSIVVPPSSLVTGYYFGAGDTIKAGYPTYSNVGTGSGNTFTATIDTSNASGGNFQGKRILRVAKNYNGGTPMFTLPFDLGSKNLSEFSAILIVARGAGASTDHGNKEMSAYINGTAIGKSSSQANQNGFSLDNNATNTATNGVIIPITVPGSNTGPLDIGFSIPSANQQNYEILSITLMPSSSLPGYNFAAGDTIDSAYLNPGPTDPGKMQVGFSSNGTSTFTGTIGSGLLSIVKNGSNTTTSFLLPFDIGSDDLNNYAGVYIGIREISNGADVSNKSLNLYLNTGSTAIGTMGNTSLSANSTAFQARFVPFTTSRTASGTVVIGIGQNQCSAYTIKVDSIILVK